MNNTFFFQTQQIMNHTIIFNQLKEQKVFYSYFQVDKNYYLFLFSQKSIDINFLYQLVQVIQELDSKQRKIRSLRGFFMYALEIMGKAEDYEILDTNLQSFFWRKVKNIIRQNKKNALLEFLFGKEQESKSVNKGSSSVLQDMEDKIQNIQSQVDSLQLETKLRFEENSKIDFKTSSNTQQDDSISNQNEAQNKTNFITLGKIPEQEKIQIIKTRNEVPSEQREQDFNLTNKARYP